MNNRTRKYSAGCGRNGIPSKRLVSPAEAKALRLTFSARFQAAREVLGISQRELALTLGVSQGRIAHYETGRGVPQADELPALCRAMKCDPNLLLGFIDDSDSDTSLRARQTNLSKDAAQMLIDAINNTGGLVALPKGLYAPVADPEWIDLAGVYLQACSEKRVEPEFSNETSPPYCEESRLA